MIEQRSGDTIGDIREGSRPRVVMHASSSAGRPAVSEEQPLWREECGIVYSALCRTLDGRALSYMKELFYLTGNYNKLYNRFFTKIEFTNCIMAVTSVK